MHRKAFEMSKSTKDITVRDFPKRELAKIKQRMERAGFGVVSDGAAVRFAAVQAAKAQWRPVVNDIKP